EWLPGYDYSDEQIDIVARLIMATVVGRTPTDLLEMIMCDADMDYLGTDEFTNTATKLLMELREKGEKISDEEWASIQINFLTKHKYYTAFSREFRKPKKEDNLRKLKASYSVNS
ncbi:MAG: phosphohydrolase, partial [Bacteroidia bacterium]|nr:phosphohydrolase [Bacteroidia bacterium]